MEMSATAVGWQQDVSVRNETAATAGARQQRQQQRDGNDVDDGSRFLGFVSEARWQQDGSEMEATMTEMAGAQTWLCGGGRAVGIW